MNKKLNRNFFNRSPKIVARELLGKVLVVIKDGEELRSRIVETEAYFGEEDPASWARFGRRKDNEVMWWKPGTILVKNVHKYFMLNFVTLGEGKASAVLIRALEPINYEGRCMGPGLLTLELGINKNDFNGRDVCSDDIIWIEESGWNGEVGKSKRIGVVGDLEEDLRFFVLGNKCVS